MTKKKASAFYNLMSRVTPHHIFSRWHHVERTTQGCEDQLWGHWDLPGGRLFPFQMCIEHLLTSGRRLRNIPRIDTAPKRSPTWACYHPNRLCSLVVRHMTSGARLLGFESQLCLSLAV